MSWHEVASPAGDPIPFTFTGATVSGGRVELGYRMADRWDLTEVVELPFDLPDTPEVAAAVRVLHLVAGVSYYKCVAPVPLAVGELLPAEAAQPDPLGEPGRVAAGHQEVPAEPQPFLRQQFAHPGLGQQVTAIAVGEVPLGLVVGVLRVHASTEDGLELVGAARMQIACGQARSERQA